MFHEAPEGERKIVNFSVSTQFPKLELTDMSLTVEAVVSVPRGKCTMFMINITKWLFLFLFLCRASIRAVCCMCKTWMPKEEGTSFISVICTYCTL